MNYPKKLFHFFFLFSDDASIIITHPELVYLENIMNDVFANINKWFRANKLALNFEKQTFVKLFFILVLQNLKFMYIDM
jgi:hypothetical protein